MIRVTKNLHFSIEFLLEPVQISWRNYWKIGCVVVSFLELASDSESIEDWYWRHTALKMFSRKHIALWTRWKNQKIDGVAARTISKVEKDTSSLPANEDTASTKNDNEAGDQDSIDFIVDNIVNLPKWSSVSPLRNTSPFLKYLAPRRRVLKVNDVCGFSASSFCRAGR